VSPGLRDDVGGPSTGLRLLALLVVVGLVVVSAPLVVVPLLRALFGVVL